ncbi:MAG: hypothetical protein HN576_09830 [Bacteriovoracaceae bacterium]|jgi:hypothetical protein|nr:hypothetical protein [Bacteriovoracaceae bacterium]
MKIIRPLQIVLILTALQMVGCLPDSFTKFEEDPPVSQGSGPPLGNAFDPSIVNSLEFPTTFSFVGDPLQNQNYAFEVGVQLNEVEYVAPDIDGTLSALSNPSSSQEQTDEVDAMEVQFYVSVTSPNPLPPGMVIDQFEGFISGAPTAIYSEPLTGLPRPIDITMSYKSLNLTRQYLTTTIFIGSYELPNPDFIMSQSDYLILNLDEAAPYNMNNFAIGDPITTTDDSGQSYVITFVDTNDSRLFIKKANPVDPTIEFRKEMFIDDATIFIAPEHKIKTVENIFPASTTMNINLVPGPNSASLGAPNGVRYFLNEELPPTMTFDSLTGILSGFLDASLPKTTFIVRVINPLYPEFLTVTAFDELDDCNNVGSCSETTFDGEVLQPPQDVSISDQLLLEVSSTANFGIGDFITSDSCNSNNPAPLPEGSKARVIGVSTVAMKNYLLVQMIDGCNFTGDFDVDGTATVPTLIDNQFPFASPKAVVYSVVPNSILLNVVNGSQFSPNDRISTAAGAQGIVTLVDVNKLYVRVTSPSLLNVFNTLDPIDNVNPFVLAETTITSIVANSLNLNFFAAGNFIPGDYVSTASGNVAEIVTVVGTNFDVILTQGEFVPAQSVDDENFFLVAETTINYIAYNQTFYLNINEYYDLNVKSGLGESVTYTIEPNEPSGMTFDANSGKLFGTPDARQDLTTYTLSATNAAGTTSYQFKLQVFDSFKLTVTTDADSFILHKAGQGNSIKPCQVTRKQMNSNSQEAKDIECYLDAGEDELFYKELDLKIELGESLCQFVRHTPYTFYRFPPVQRGIAPVYEHTIAGGDNITTCRNAGAGAPNAAFTTDALGGTPAGNGIEAQSVCKSEYEGGDYTDIEEWATAGLGALYETFDKPNCDQSEFQTIQREWSKVDFECTVPAQDEASCVTALGTHNNPDAPGFGGQVAPDRMDDCHTPITGASVPVDCGGDIGFCVGTAFKDYEGDADLMQGPTTQISAIPSTETNISYLYTAPNVSPYRGYTAFRSNLSVANYPRGASCTINQYKMNTVDSYVTPTAGYLLEAKTPQIFPNNNYLNSGTSGTNPLYTYVCTDGSGTPKARIQLYVREWDDEFSSQSSIDFALPPGPGAGTPLDLMDASAALDSFGMPINEIKDQYDYNLVTGDSCTVGGSAFNFDNSSTFTLYPEGLGHDGFPLWKF